MSKFTTPFYVKQENGRYRPADQAEVMDYASLLRWKSALGSNVLSSPEATRAFLKDRLSTEKNELFGIIFVDNRHRVLSFDVLFQGTIDGSSVHPRVVVQAVLDNNAAAVIFAHNHPSGLAEPSQADLRITQRLKDALALIEVRVLDHLIVGGDSITSFADRGLL